MYCWQDALWLRLPFSSCSKRLTGWCAFWKCVAIWIRSASSASLHACAQTCERSDHADAFGHGQGLVSRAIRKLLHVQRSLTIQVAAAAGLWLTALGHVFVALDSSSSATERCEHLPDAAVANRHTLRCWHSSGSVPEAVRCVLQQYVPDPVEAGSHQRFHHSFYSAL